MKKIFAVLIILMLSSILFACSGDNFNKLVIDAGDVAGVAEGEYTLIYSIKNYEKFLKKYPDMEIFVTAVDDHNNTVTVTNNRTITVEKDRIYTVRVAIYATVDDVLEQKTKLFTVTAVKSDPVVVLHVGDTVFRRFDDLKYGDSLDISLLPEVPDSVPDEYGYRYEVLDKKWTLSTVKSNEYKSYSQGDFADLQNLSQNDLDDLKTSVDIYAAYVCKKTAKTFSIVFHNDGGTATETISKPYLSTLNCPDYPTKENCVFDGWYTEAELKNRFNWKINGAITNNYHLYAKWLPVTDNALNAQYDYEVLSDSCGYKYCLARPKTDMAGEITLPRNNGNYPVKGLSSYAFMGMGVTSATIPAQYDDNTYGAFKDCTSLTSVSFEEGSRVISLHQETFLNCSSLVTVVLPSKLTRIDLKCFEGCSSLTSITIPDSVTYINSWAFKNCSELSSVVISPTSRLTAFGENVLLNTAVTEITLPASFAGNDPFSGTGIIVHYYGE